MFGRKARHVQSIFKMKPKKSATVKPDNSTQPNPRQAQVSNHNHHQAPSSGHGSVLADAGPDAAAHLPILLPQGYSLAPGPGPRSFFQGSSNFHLDKFAYNDLSRAVHAGSYVDASYNVTYGPNSGTSSKGWETLVQNTAPHALLEAQGIDAPQCDADTRSDVLADIMSFIHSSPSSLQRMLCITGPVGCGKSALQYTTAESCASNGILAASFFFSWTDTTRNSPARLVPTIAYQLATTLDDHALRSHITQSVERDPLIFKKSLKTQMESLILGPLRQTFASRASGPAPIRLPAFPHVLVIDGLDECSDEKSQTEVLEALHYLVSASLPGLPSPFRAIVTSRPEWSIWTSLEDSNGPLSSSSSSNPNRIVRHIKLSDDYDATPDISNFIRHRLSDIASRSHDPRCTKAWPKDEDVETLVDNASGQFIYAVIVLNYISERRSSPVDRLSTVLSWSRSVSGLSSSPTTAAAPAPATRRSLRARQGSTQHPLSALDVLYTRILQTARAAYDEAEHDIEDMIMLLRLHQFNMEGRFTSPTIDARAHSLQLPAFEVFLGMLEGTTYSLISDMRSLLTVRKLQRNTVKSLGDHLVEPGMGEREHIHFYHKSLLDFLDDPSRAGDLYVPPEAVGLQFVTCALEKIGGAQSYDFDMLLNDENASTPSEDDGPTTYHSVLEYSIQTLCLALPHIQNLSSELTDSLYRFTEDGGWEKLDRYVRVTRSSVAFGRGLEVAMGLYHETVSKKDGELGRDFGRCSSALSETEVERVMEIVDEYRGKWLART